MTKKQKRYAELSTDPEAFVEAANSPDIADLSADITLTDQLIERAMTALNGKALSDAERKSLTLAINAFETAVAKCDKKRQVNVWQRIKAIA